MKKVWFFLIIISLISFTACEDDDDFADGEVDIPNFNFAQTINFAQSLSTYNIFQGTPADLQPAEDYQLLELSSILYTDHAHKQRLVKVPTGTQLMRLNDGSIDFPDGTILVKTFYYYHDERDKTLGKRIIETRLMIKENNSWNVATYIWNDNQTDAVLELDGADTQISWINTEGSTLSTLYHIPTGNECITCHQADNNVIPLGTTLRNLNREVLRNGQSINQISYLQSVGIVHDFLINEVSQIVNYQDVNASLVDRARAYLAMNCAHCHNPFAWEEPAEEGFDFRYETPLNLTGILESEEDIIEVVSDGEMPFIGTTLIDQTGVDLIISYIESL